jgi:hypothetical protein
VRDGLDQVLEVSFDENSGAAVVRRGATTQSDAFENAVAAVGDQG